MKRFLFSIAIVATLVAAFKSDNTGKAFLQDNFSFADKQLKNMLAETASTPLGFPRSADSSGKLITTNMYEWTSGFFPGSLWYAYEYTKDPQLKTAAAEWTERLEPLKTFTQHHDLGFMLYCSYGNAYRLTGNPAYKNLLVEGAKSLSTRFSPATGSIKSWNGFRSWSGSTTVYNYPVIIDNLMNLEMLFFASKVTGDSSYRHIAITHALNALKNHVRKDYSSYHVVCYDSATGKVVLQETAQGYADNSTWARGQAWGVYGFTLCYRETKDKGFLKTAQGMADWYINNKNLPADKIPYWDFNVGQQGYTPGVKSWAKDHPLKLRDASAAAIVSSALLELSTYVDAARSAQYKAAALQMLQSLGSPAYRASVGKNANFLLEHSVGALSYASELDVPLVYADYYFLEALNRYSRLLEGKSVVL